MVNLINNILEDYTNYCRLTLEDEFTEYKPTKDDPILDYQRYKYRILSSRPREVIEAKDLDVPDQYSDAYAEIVKDISEGNPLKKYQSRKLKRISYNDDMLSHWRIQHFHLGKDIEKDGFVKRTGDLLFIFFVNQKAYVLGFFSHGDWCDLDIIETIHQNWPDELMHYRGQKEGRVLTAEEYKILRQKNINTTIVVKDGTAYFGPGMGVMAGGAPAEAVANAHRVKMNFENDFKTISLSFDQIKNSGDVNQSLVDTATIGLEMNHEIRKFVYKIYETDFRFTLDIN